MKFLSATFVFVPKGKGEGKKESVQRPAKLELLQTQKPTTTSQRGKKIVKAKCRFFPRGAPYDCVLLARKLCVVVLPKKANDCCHTAKTIMAAVCSVNVEVGFIFALSTVYLQTKPFGCMIPLEGWGRVFSTAQILMFTEGYFS